MSASELCLILLLGGCGDKAGNDDGSGTSGDGGTLGDGGTSGDGGSSGDGGTTGTADEDLFRDAIEGEVDPTTALAGIASSGGLPVQTERGTWLFGCLCGDGTWYLAGDHGDWVPAEMARAGELSWIEVEITEPVDSLYKFTDGGERWLADPLARRYGYDEYGQYSLVQAERAHLERWTGVEGMGLAARELRVWVPEGGRFRHALYAHDGQNLFDPEAIWGGWHLQDSLPPEILVVGIDNSADRMDEYTHVEDELHGTRYGGDGDAYADLVHEVIRPMMDAAYGPAEVYGLLGSSLGGLISFHIAGREPEAWDMVASLSGTMGWGSIGLHEPTMPELWQDAGYRPMVLYLDSGGGGETCVDADLDGVPDDDPTASDNYCENAWFRDVLSDLGYAYDVELFHWHEPGATHDELAWATRVWRPLDLFAGL